MEEPLGHEGCVPVVKVTPVSGLQMESNETPVSSAGEDDDVIEFHEMLKDDPKWKPPTPELAAKIRTLLEHYFSDENLLKDKFLLKHVKRNRFGYVSVKLLTSFKKLKNLSRTDWKITAYCLSKSDKFELNKSGTKVRRKEPLPEVDLPTTSIRTLLYKLPEGAEDPTLEEMSKHFQSFGELTTIRIIRPDKEVPLDLRNHTSKHPELGVHTCVVVEYESTDAAQNAFKTLSKQTREDNRPDMYNLLGSGRNPRKQTGKSKTHDGSHYDSSEDSPYFSSRESSPLVWRKLANGRNVGRSKSPLVSPHGSRDGSPLGKNARSPKSSPRMQRKNNSNTRDSSSGTASRENDSPNRNIAVKNPAHHKTKSPLAVSNTSLSQGDSTSGPTTGGSSPWLQRRREFVASQGNSPASTPGSSPILGRKFQDGVPLGVTRLPKGPPKQDSKGFETDWKQRLRDEVVNRDEY